MATFADLMIAALKNAGISRLFGMPGGGSNTDLIEAAGRAGLPFTLAHTETGSAFMASAQAEITGKPAACIATLGPGAASITNGIANASLDRVPLLVITDCHPEAVASAMQHQTLRHGELFSSLCKSSTRLTKENFAGAFLAALDAVSRPPFGPVHLDVSPDVTGASVSIEIGTDFRSDCVEAAVSEAVISDEVRELLAAAKRPVFLIGLGARTKHISSVLRQLCEEFGIPALVTYKAKGVIPDEYPWFGGVFTNGALERALLERADLFLATGLDTVELLPRAWTLSQPVVGISAHPLDQKQVPLRAELIGDIAKSLGALAQHLHSPLDWTETEIASFVAHQREAMRPSKETSTLLPHRVVEVTAEVYAGTRITVDAGAHMFPVMSLWPAREACDVLISNGLSTMGFALPAAIGAALLDCTEPVVCFTGDAGLLICLGELSTAAREKLPLRIIVFDDRALSLIKIKQVQRGYPIDGVGLGEIDWQRIGEAFGLTTRAAANEAEFRAALVETAHCPGPVLIAAKVDPETYLATMRALRG